MDHGVTLYAGCAGISLAMLTSAIFWRIRSKERHNSELFNLEINAPLARDGLLLSALVINVGSTDGSPETWLSNLWLAIDSIVEQRNLTKVGTYRNTYMVAASEYRIAEESLMQTALTALEIRDAIAIFALEKSLYLDSTFGISADIIPTMGLGSTVALSQLWNATLEIAEHGKPNAIELSGAATTWLGSKFNIERFCETPALYTRRAA